MEQYMQRALALAQMAYDLGEVPVGAVVVRSSTGEIIGEGYNLREQSKSPLAHAEVLAIAAAAKHLGGWRLIGCTLYVTLEPCPMCCGAIINSRIERVVFGASDPKGGACGSVVDLFALPFNHKPELISGVLKQPCAALLKQFFRERRLADKE